MAPDSFSLIGLCFISLCILATIVGVTLIYVAFYKKSSLRNNSNALFVSLVTADLLTAFIVLPGEMVSLWNPPYWPLGDIACRLWNTFFVTFASLSVINLCFISLERLWALKRPFLYDSTLLSTKGLLLLAFIWIFSLFCGIYSFFIWYINVGQTCQQLSAPLEYSAPLLFFDVLAPYIACLIAYAKIFQISHGHAKNINIVEGNLNNNLANGRRRNVMAQLLARKSTFTLGLLVGSFTVCCFPFFMYHTLDGVFYEQLAGRYVSGHIMKWLIFVSSATNWALYGFLNRDFRQAMLRILRKLRLGRNNSVSTIQSLTQ